MSYPLDILVIVLSVIAAAFFAGAETALTAASRARMHALETAGDKRAKLVTRLIGARGRLISAMLLGGQLVTIGSSAIATSVLLEAFGERGVWAATAIMTALIVVFGEVMPKTIAIAYPDRVSLLLAPLVSFFVTVFGPIVSAVEILVRGVLRLCGVSLGDGDPGVSGHEELKGAVDILHRDGEVERDERDMFGGLLELVRDPGLGRHGSSHQDAAHRRRPAARRACARSHRFPLYEDATLAWRARQHHWHPTRQGPAQGVCRGWRRRQ